VKGLWILNETFDDLSMKSKKIICGQIDIDFLKQVATVFSGREIVICS